jgi:hypothetical protein
MDVGGARRELGLSNHRCIRPAATFSPADAAAATRGSSAAPARTATLALDARPLAMEWPPLGLGFRKMALMLAKRVAGCGSGAAQSPALSSARDLPCRETRCPAASCGETLLERHVLRPPGLIDEQSAEETGAGADSGTKTGIATNRAKYRAATRADCRAGQRPLLGWGHVGATNERQCQRAEPKKLLHAISPN